MKRIALINDLSGFGKCSLTAAIPVTSVMGIQACPLPTAILSSQTGFPSFSYHDFTDKMDQFTTEWKKLNVTFDGIYSGFLGNASQMKQVLFFLEQFHAKNTVYLADPVLGDNGNTIKSFNNELLNGMKTLVAASDICTPNLTELCLLTGTDYDSIISSISKEEMIKRVECCAKQLIHGASNKKVIVTGLVYHAHGTATIGNMALSANETIYQETLYTGESFSGTGDLFATVICCALVKGYSMEKAMQTATAFLQPAIEEATRLQIPRNHGIHFENYLPLLLDK